MNETKHGDLRVWWIPQVPMTPFYVAVPDLKTARLVLGALAQYDLFQLEHHVKPDFSNAGGLQVFQDGEDGGWIDWYTDDGRCIDELADDDLASARWEMAETEAR